MARLERLVPLLVLSLGLVVGCAGAAPILEIPPVDEEEGLVPHPGEEAVTPLNWQPETVGPHVRLGLLELAAGRGYDGEGSACEEVIVYIAAGRVQDGAAVRDQGTLLRTQDRLALTALEPARLVVALVTAPTDECVFTDDVLRQRTAGQSVNVLLPPGPGSYGSFTVFDHPASDNVPMHDNPMNESLLVAEGDAVLVLGEGTAEHSVALSVGQVVYIPAGQQHTLRDGSASFRVFQILTQPEAVVAGPATALEDSSAEQPVPATTAEQ